MDVFVTLGIIVALILLYFCPTMIAVDRRARPLGLVVLLNLVLGWTIVGWFAALLIALLSPTLPARTTRNCPHCAEPIKVEARVCPHCRNEVPEPPAPPRPEPGRGFIAIGSRRAAR